jgi:hypothetical protein
VRGARTLAAAGAHATRCARARQAPALREQLSRAQETGAALRTALASAQVVEEALRSDSAALRARLAGALADVTELRLEVSRLRGEVSSPRQDTASAPARRSSGGSGALAPAASSHAAARVQAAVQAQLRALRADDKQRNSCAICMERPRNTALQCGHTYCGTCAAALFACALCRQEVLLRIHLYH